MDTPEQIKLSRLRDSERDSLGAEVRKENAGVKQSGVLSLERHREVLSIYTDVVRDAVTRCGLTIPPATKHAGLVLLLVNEIHRLRGQIAVSSPLVVSPSMEVIDNGIPTPSAASVDPTSNGAVATEL